MSLMLIFYHNGLATAAVWIVILQLLAYVHTCLRPSFYFLFFFFSSTLFLRLCRDAEHACSPQFLARTFPVFWTSFKKYFNLAKDWFEYAPLMACPQVRSLTFIFLLLGVMLSLEGTSLSVYNRSEVPLFVNSPTLDPPPSSRTFAVYKILPGYSMKVGLQNWILILDA